MARHGQARQMSVSAVCAQGSACKADASVWRVHEARPRLAEYLLIEDLDNELVKGRRRPEGGFDDSE